MPDPAERYDLVADWRWDSYIVGCGATPAQDRHLVRMQGLVLPHHASIVFPVADAVAMVREAAERDPESAPTCETCQQPVKVRGLPLVEFSRIELALRLSVTQDGYTMLRPTT